jgi:hypothetical protein
MPYRKEVLAYYRLPCHTERRSWPTAGCHAIQQEEERKRLSTLESNILNLLFVMSVDFPLSLATCANKRQTPIDKPVNMCFARE